MKKIPLFLLILLHLFILSHLTFTAWPEMISYPYLFLNGFTIYKDFAAPYTPFLIFILAFTFKLFGFSVIAIKGFTWATLMGNDLLLFLILKELKIRYFIIFILLLVYIFISSFLDGNMLWIDNVLVAPMLLSLFFGIKWVDKKKNKWLFLATLFLSFTALMKQTSLIYLTLFSIYFLYHTRKNLSRFKIFFLGIFAGFIILFEYLAANQIFVDFYNWIFWYPVKYWGRFPGYIDFALSRNEKWLLVFYITIFLWVIPQFKVFARNKIFILVSLYFLAALIAVFPRFSFFHLQSTFALLVILSGIIYKSIKKPVNYYFLLNITVFSLTLIFLNRDYVLGKDVRFYGEDDKKLTLQIQKALGREKKTYFLGIPSSQYVFTNTLPPKPWVEGFGWYMESPGVQEQFIKGLDGENIQTIFIKRPGIGNWYDLAVYQPKRVISYIYNNYRLSGIINGDIEVWKKN